MKEKLAQVLLIAMVGGAAMFANDIRTAMAEPECWEWRLKAPVVDDREPQAVEVDARHDDISQFREGPTDEPWPECKETLKET